MSSNIINNQCSGDSQGEYKVDRGSYPEWVRDDQSCKSTILEKVRMNEKTEFTLTFQIIIAQDYILHLTILPFAVHRPYNGTKSEDLHLHHGGLENPHVHAAHTAHCSPLLTVYASHLGFYSCHSKTETNKKYQHNSDNKAATWTSRSRWTGDGRPAKHCGD